jgi:hypothetical protein
VLTRVVRSRPLLIALLAAAAAPATAGATGFDAIPEPRRLPGDAAAASINADPATWMVGAEPSAAASAAARSFGARRIGPGGDYVIAHSRARAFARALGPALVYAQPNAYTMPLQAVPDDPLSAPPNAWRAVIAPPDLAPPPVTDTSPLIALIDTRADETHPEFGGGRMTTLGGRPVDNLHGTATASLAVAPANGVGILGVWPGARALNVPLPPARITCADSAGGIQRAIDAGAAVINMSYGSRRLCRAEYAALQRAVSRGVIPVAAAGNEFAEGNPPEFPASLPHVLTVAAVNARLRSSAFSNANQAVDLSAPGESILAAVPPALEEDETKDGYQALDGTSLSAPMVSAAVAWVRAARPDLAPDQVAQVVRLSARDLARKGYDDDTGFGLLDVRAALTKRPPPHDPLEPNDDVTWVNGRSFGTPTPPIFLGRQTVRLKAIVDAYEDPVDVYRVRLRPRSRVRVTANPSFGNPVLAGFAPGTRSVSRKPQAISRRRGGKTERITLRNRSRRVRTFFVGVGVQSGRVVDAGYRLTIGRG